MNKIIQGDCLEEMKKIPDNSVDSIVTDPPYELGFMGKAWDNTGIANNREVWSEALRVLKPGGYLLAFGGTRTYHRMAVAIEDAGFEVRDMIEWVMGSGFPKSLNIFKQLEKRCDCGIMSEYGERTTKNTKHYLRPLREADLQKAKHITEEQREVLFKGLPKQSLPTEEVREGLFISERAGEPSMEGRCYLFQKERELYRCAICQMSPGVFSDGEKGWLYNGAPTCSGNTHRETFNEDGSSTSREPQPRRQQDREPCAFCKQFGAQAIRAYGWGSAMKPAHEPICVARKPLSENNIADNFLKYGTGGINIDESRVGTEERYNAPAGNKAGGNSLNMSAVGMPQDVEGTTATGRFPANLIHDNSEEVRECFPESNSGKSKASTYEKFGGQWGKGKQIRNEDYGDSGNASRFFKSIDFGEICRYCHSENEEKYVYCQVCGKRSERMQNLVDSVAGKSIIYQAKASKSERNKGCEELESKFTKTMNDGIGMREHNENEPTAYNKNNHPTVKPVALMEYLIKMVTPKGGTVLDPFMGSGSTGVAAKQNSFDFIGIELDEGYCEIARKRIAETQMPIL